MDIVELVVPAAIGAGGALLGAWLSGHQTFRLAELNFRNSRQGEERLRLQRVAQLLESSTSSMELLLPFYRAASMTDLAEFADTDSGKLQREQSMELKDLLIAGKVGAQSEAVRRSYVELETALAAFSREAIHPLTSSKKDHEVVDSLRILWAFQRQFREIVNQSIVVLNEPRRGVFARGWLLGAKAAKRMKTWLFKRKRAKSADSHQSET